MLLYSCIYGVLGDLAINRKRTQFNMLICFGLLYLSVFQFALIHFDERWKKIHHLLPQAA
jgi:NADH:ubiquinone oxidoreductase subunit K